MKPKKRNPKKSPLRKLLDNLSNPKQSGTLLDKVNLHDLNPGDEWKVYQDTEEYFTDFYTFDGVRYHVAFPEEVQKIELKPGSKEIAVTPDGEIILKNIDFSDDVFFDDFDVIEQIQNEIKTFFNKTHLYEELEIFPKRGILLYGPPGTGKSTTIGYMCKNYLNSKNTLVLNWNTTRIHANAISGMLRRAIINKKLKQLIIIAEDIGGSNKAYSDNLDSALLEVLDNTKKIYKIPTLIIGTTNYPENLLETLTNRPQRFDSIINVGYLSDAMKVNFYEKLSKTAAKDSVKELLKKNKYLTFSHIKELVIREKIFNEDFELAFNRMSEHMEKVKEAFEERRQLGMGFHD